MNQIFSQLPIPLKKVICTEGVFSWPHKPLLVSERLTDRIALEQLQRKLKKRLKVNSRIAYNAFGPAPLRIRRDPAFHKDRPPKLNSKRVAGSGI